MLRGHFEKFRPIISMQTSCWFTSCAKSAKLPKEKNDKVGVRVGAPLKTIARMWFSVKGESQIGSGLSFFVVIIYGHIT